MKVPVKTRTFVAICTDCRPIRPLYFRTLGEQIGWRDDHTFTHPDHEVVLKEGTA